MSLVNRELREQLDKRAAKTWFHLRAIQRLVQKKLARPAKAIQPVANPRDSRVVH